MTTTHLTLSLVALTLCAFTAGALWQRARNSAALKTQINKLKSSNDALEQALKHNQTKKG